MVATTLLELDARESITLKSNNPLDPPNMSYSFYENGTDLEDTYIYSLKTQSN